MMIPAPTTSGSWVHELRARCLAAGYGGVLVGACDVEGLDRAGRGFCRQRPHGIGPTVRYHPRAGSDAPAIWAILADLGVPWASASCHWVSLDRRRMSPEQLAALDRAASRTWVCERDERVVDVEAQPCSAPSAHR